MHYAWCRSGAVPGEVHLSPALGQPHEWTCAGRAARRMLSTWRQLQQKPRTRALSVCRSDAAGEECPLEMRPSRALSGLCSTPAGIGFALDKLLDFICQVILLQDEANIMLEFGGLLSKRVLN